MRRIDWWITFGAKLTVLVVLWGVISFCWIGAECVIEGFGQYGKVDMFVAGLLAQLIMQNINRLDEQLKNK